LEGGIIMAEMKLDQVRKILEVVVGPEDLAAKVPELGFKKADDLLKASGFSKAPALPSEALINKAKEQKKALIFRVSKNGEGKEVTLSWMKQAFGPMIYSSWFLNPPAPFVSEPIKAGWALADLDPMPESDEKTYDEQKEFVKAQSVRLKSTAADAYDLIVAQKVAGKYFRDEPKNARTADTVANEPVKISHFNKSGMAISTGWGKTVRSNEIGAATELAL
jgi:hypothetical protein